MSEELKPQPTDTAADLKMKIEKMQAQRSDAKGAPLADGKTPTPTEVHSEPKAEKADKATVVPQPKPSAEQKGEKTSPHKDVDLQNWAKSKGIDWTSDSSVLEALRRSDIEFHKRRQEKLKEQPNIPAPSYPHHSSQPAPVYQSSAPMQLPRPALEKLSRDYNMAIEDVERLLAFNNDFVEAKMNIERQRLQKEFEEIKKATTKNDIFRELSSDPVFRNPQVMQEYYRVIEEEQEVDPRSFEEDPNAYRRAYERAQLNMFRRNLQGESQAAAIQANPFVPPSNPPRPIGNGGTGEMRRENELSSEEFSRLPVDEQRAILSRMGLIAAKY